MHSCCSLAVCVSANSSAIIGSRENKLGMIVPANIEYHAPTVPTSRTFALVDLIHERYNLLSKLRATCQCCQVERRVAESRASLIVAFFACFHFEFYA